MRPRLQLRVQRHEPLGGFALLPRARMSGLALTAVSSAAGAGRLGTSSRSRQLSGSSAEAQHMRTLEGDFDRAPARIRFCARMGQVPPRPHERAATRSSEKRTAPARLPSGNVDRLGRDATPDHQERRVERS